VVGWAVFIGGGAAGWESEGWEVDWWWGGVVGGGTTVGRGIQAGGWFFAVVEEGFCVDRGH
jgi:hypothetical protein